MDSRVISGSVEVKLPLFIFKLAGKGKIKKELVPVNTAVRLFGKILGLTVS